MTEDSPLYIDGGLVERAGRIHIIKTFVYSSGMIPNKEDSGERKGQQLYSLAQYIRFLIKFDKSAYKRMKNVESKINQMYSAIKSLDKQR